MTGYGFLRIVEDRRCLFACLLIGYRKSLRLGLFDLRSILVEARFDLTERSPSFHYEKHSLVLASHRIWLIVLRIEVFSAKSSMFL